MHKLVYRWFPSLRCFQTSVRIIFHDGICPIFNESVTQNKIEQVLYHL